jgi:Mg/Co/Ni transporter MgtE
MKERRVRHLPVLDEDNHLLGLISIGDINAFEASTREQTIVLMHEYLHGRV